MSELEELRKQKDQAYWERNQLVAALSKLYPAWLSRHEESDTAWEQDWKWIVFIEIPTRWAYGDQRNILPEKLQYEPKQVSWHIHDSELQYFRHLEERLNTWDRHTTEEKFRRLKNIEGKK